MKKVIIILVYLFIVHINFAQTDCNIASVKAQTDFKNSDLIFHSEEVIPVEQTYFYVLNEYYNINMRFVDSDSIQYYECYDSTLTILLKEKYGDDFLQRVSEITDSLETTINWRKNAEFPEGKIEMMKYFKDSWLYSNFR